ncbi:WD repeat-containing protein 43 [Hordeum vulgare]|nr:WD repeat-containing protein 43 [Hordeum vulgare]
MIDNSHEKYGVDVPTHMAYRAKNLDLQAVLGEHKQEYPRLRDYAQTIMDTKPGSRVVVTTVTPKPTTKRPHPRPRFQAMFFYINGAREGFLNGCRPFIGIDGCFIKMSTSAQFLAVTGRDGNNNIFPPAFAIVGQEDTSNWCWFLHQLKICIGGEYGKYGPYTIMYDRQKGLLNAVNQVFPNLHQRFRLRHLYANFQNVAPARSQSPSRSSQPQAARSRQQAIVSQPATRSQPSARPFSAPRASTCGTSTAGAPLSVGAPPTAGGPTNHTD